MTLIRTASAARAAGATITRDGDRLIIRGPAAVKPYAAALLARKDEVLTLVDVLAGAATTVDWRGATLATKPGRCVICGGKALLLDPYDRKPMHKVCAEGALTTPAMEGTAAA